MISEFFNRPTGIIIHMNNLIREDAAGKGEGGRGKLALWREGGRVG